MHAKKFVSNVRVFIWNVKVVIEALLNACAMSNYLKSVTTIPNITIDLPCEARSAFNFIFTSL